MNSDAKKALAASMKYTEETIIGQGAIKGDKGDPGPQGPQGEKGDKGDKGDPGSIENVSMADLEDVQLTDPMQNDILMYEETAKMWVNKNMPTIPSKTSDLENDTKFQTEDNLNDAIGEVNDRIDEIELFKFPNTVIVGEPTINHGQISNFSATDYLKFPFLVDFQNKGFEILMGITTGTNVTNQENIFDSDFGLAFAIRAGKFVIAISSNGTSWNLGEGVGTYDVQPNTTYVLKLSWDKLTYKLDYSTDGGKTFINDISKVTAIQPYPKQIFIGVGENFATVVNHFTGIIDLNKASLKIANELVWQGMDDVGLATRLATDLANIDADGIEAINNIIDTNTNVIHNGDSAVYFNDVTISDDLQVKGTLFLGSGDDKRSLDSILDDKVDVDSPSFTGTISTDKNISATNGKVSTKQIVGTKIAGTEGTPNYVTDRLDINGGATASSSSVTGMQINSGGSKLKVLSGTTEINATDELNLISADINISSTGTSGNKIEVRSQGEINIGSDNDVTISSHGKLVKVTMDGARVKINNGRLECDHGARIDDHLEVGQLSGIGTSDYIGLAGSGIELGNNSPYGFVARSTNNVSTSDGGKYDERGVVLGDLDNALGFKSKYFVNMSFAINTSNSEIYNAIKGLVFPTSLSSVRRATTCMGYLIGSNYVAMAIRGITLSAVGDITLQYFSDMDSENDDSNISRMTFKPGQTGNCIYAIVLCVPRIVDHNEVKTFYSL